MSGANTEMPDLTHPLDDKLDDMETRTIQKSDADRSRHTREDIK